MPSANVTMFEETVFELPPALVVAERRLAGRALDLWRAAEGRMVAGFEQNQLVITEADGLATVETIGGAITAVFDVMVGDRLEGKEGLAAELRAACHLIALHLQPVPFETSLSTPRRSIVLARGVALPIGRCNNQSPARVQFIISWRELLDRTATTRLRRELAAALHLATPNFAKIDPFPPKTRA